MKYKYSTCIGCTINISKETFLFGLEQPQISCFWCTSKLNYLTRFAISLGSLLFCNRVYIGNGWDHYWPIPSLEDFPYPSSDVLALWSPWSIITYHSVNMYFLLCEDRIWKVYVIHMHKHWWLFIKQQVSK